MTETHDTTARGNPAGSRKDARAAGAIERRVRWACTFALVALALIIWSLVHPAPLPVIGAMSVGQLLGTLSLLFFLYAIVLDLRPALAGVRGRAKKSASSVVDE